MKIYFNVDCSNPIEVRVEDVAAINEILNAKPWNLTNLFITPPL